jgi:hypothetical protein
MTQKYGSVDHVKVRYLFHGTSKTNPLAIYSSEEGFNMNYANEGMWGKANYFAANSVYSNSYKFQLPDGTSQMFFARVILGKSVTLNPDKKLKEPPK